MAPSTPTLPPEAAEVLRPVLPRLADEIIATIAAEIPDYERALAGAFGEVVRLGVEVALNRFIDVLVGERERALRARSTYVNLGRGEFHAGRSLEALLGAYRSGARLTWRRFVDAGREAGLPPEALYDLGEAIYAFIDELSAESAEGYAEEQSAAAGETQRRRQRLVRLLVEDPPPGEEAVRTAAQAAGWALPPAVAAVVAAQADQAEASDAAPAPADDAQATPPQSAIVDAIATRLARRVGGGAIGAAVGSLAVVVLPDPDAPGRRRALRAALDEEAVALGPSVAWPDAGRSLRRAAAAFRLAAQGRLGSGRAEVIVAERHLADLLLAADPDLARDLAALRLAPLEALGSGARERLAPTLRAWLDRPGQVQAVAADLGVHPQTVRYRVRKLRELFGEDLDDPDARFELALALRATERIRYS